MFSEVLAPNLRDPGRLPPLALRRRDLPLNLLDLEERLLRNGRQIDLDRCITPSGRHCRHASRGSGCVWRWGRGCRHRGVGRVLSNLSPPPKSERHQPVHASPLNCRELTRGKPLVGALALVADRAQNDAARPGRSWGGQRAVERATEELATCSGLDLLGVRILRGSWILGAAKTSFTTSRAISRI